ncbi:helix-turn-helix domain-containing protein [Nocardioides sp.]|uniref:helix-turn-helix domain-containing protein n=1 Tax=Nocardioides sp. TaxID=35761 RepID=UPI0035B1445D
MTFTQTITQTDVDPQERKDWTEAELEYYLMGPFDGEIPGLVRRIRRILDVSQRGLAGLLGISQSQVARWETRRTSPRTAVLVEMLRLAKVRIGLHHEESGKLVEPMRDDGARDRALRRYPAHVDLEVAGWWEPRDAMMTADGMRWRARSRRWGIPAVRYHHPFWKQVFREVRGTPVDHPARHQLVAEAVHLDEVREERLRRTAPLPPGTMSA